MSTSNAFDPRREGLELFIIARGARQGAMIVDSAWPSLAKAKARFEMLRDNEKFWFYLGPANDYLAAEVVMFGVSPGSSIIGNLPEGWDCAVAASVTTCDTCGRYPLMDVWPRPCISCEYDASEQACEDGAP